MYTKQVFSHLWAMNKVYLSLGSNRGDRQANLAKAITLLGEKAGSVIAQSGLYETAPWKMDDDTPFINQVVLLETALATNELMQCILMIEEKLGRVRNSQKYEPRTIDIDILFINNEVLKTDSVVVPHPFIQERKFVLEPLNEIAQDYLHPVLKKTVNELLLLCKDTGKVIHLATK